MSTNDLKLPAQTSVIFFFRLPTSRALTFVADLSFNPCPREVTMFKDKRGRTIH